MRDAFCADAGRLFSGAIAPRTRGAAIFSGRFLTAMPATEFAREMAAREREG